MGKVIDQELFVKEVFDFLDETFETHHGIFLDKGTSLFETLATISAAEASQPVRCKCASLAAQVAHVTFYLEVIERDILAQESGKVDWGEIWRTVQEVTPDKWVLLQQQLQATYNRICVLLRGLENWDNETAIDGVLAIMIHTAYHLGEIRQALCILK